MSLRGVVGDHLRRGSSPPIDTNPGNTFERSDVDAEVNELEEVFSLSESIDLLIGARLSTLFGDGAGVMEAMLGQLLDDLGDRDQVRRLKAGDALCACLVGAKAAGASSDRIETGRLVAKQLTRLGGVARVVAGMGAAVRALDALERTGKRADAPAPYWVTSKEVRLHFNIALLLLILQRNDAAVVGQFANCKCDGKHLLAFCLDMIAAESTDMYPLKKVLMLVRWVLLLVHGGVATSKFEHAPVAVKSRRRDVFNACRHINECFGPVLCIPNPVHLNELARKHIHVGYADTDDMIALGPHLTVADSPTAAVSTALYRLLQPKLRSYVIGILKVLLAVAPNARASATPMMTNACNEYVIGPGLEALHETVERARHIEILTKSSAFILLSLLKAFRRGHPLQFATLSCLLQDKNCYVLVLKFLNQNVGSSMMKRNDVPELSPFEASMWAMKDTACVMRTLTRATPFLGQSCFRKYSAYSNMLRVLQKTTKGCPRQLRSLVKFRAPIILQRLLSIPQRDIIVYTLKLLKSQASFMERKWKTEHTEIISAVFHSIRQDLFEDWLDLVPSDDATLNQEQMGAKVIRQLCLSYNSSLAASADPNPIYTLSADASDDEILQCALREKHTEWHVIASEREGIAAS